MPASKEQNIELLTNHFVLGGFATKVEHLLDRGQNNYILSFKDKLAGQSVLDYIDGLGVKGARGKKVLVGVSAQGNELFKELDAEGNIIWFDQVPEIGTNGVFCDNTGKVITTPVAGYQIIFTDANMDQLSTGLAKQKERVEAAQENAQVIKNTKDIEELDRLAVESRQEFCLQLGNGHYLDYRLGDGKMYRLYRSDAPIQNIAEKGQAWNLDEGGKICQFEFERSANGRVLKITDEKMKKDDAIKKEIAAQELLGVKKLGSLLLNILPYKQGDKKTKPFDFNGTQLYFALERVATSWGKFLVIQVEDSKGNILNRMGDEYSESNVKMPISQFLELYNEINGQLNGRLSESLKVLSEHKSLEMKEKGGKTTSFAQGVVSIASTIGQRTNQQDSVIVGKVGQEITKEGLHEKLGGVIARYRDHQNGSTICTAIAKKDANRKISILTSNYGDARASLVLKYHDKVSEKTASIALTEDFSFAADSRFTRVVEGKEVGGQKGVVREGRIFGDLATVGAGDKGLNQYFPDHETNLFQINLDQPTALGLEAGDTITDIALVVSCDGVVEVIESEQGFVQSGPKNSNTLTTKTLGGKADLAAVGGIFDDQAANGLVQKAYQLGSRDNITASVFQIVKGGAVKVVDPVMLTVCDGHGSSSNYALNSADCDGAVVSAKVAAQIVKDFNVQPVHDAANFPQPFFDYANRNRDLLPQTIPQTPTPAQSKVIKVASSSQQAEAASSASSKAPTAFLDPKAAMGPQPLEGDILGDIFSVALEDNDEQTRLAMEDGIALIKSKLGTHVKEVDSYYYGKDIGYQLLFDTTTAAKEFRFLLHTEKSKGGFGIKADTRQGFTIQSICEDGKIFHPPYIDALPEIGQSFQCKGVEAKALKHRILFGQKQLDQLRGENAQSAPAASAAQQAANAAVQPAAPDINPEGVAIFQNMISKAKEGGLSPTVTDALMTHYPEANKVFSERTKEKAEEILKSTRAVVSEEVLNLMKRQIICVFKYGTEIEKKCYCEQIFANKVPLAVKEIEALGDDAAYRVITDEHLNNFIKRLQNKRPVVFVGSTDWTMLRNGDKDAFDEKGNPLPSKFDFTNLHNLDSQNSRHFCFDEYINYDEMAISSLVGVSSKAEFINQGDRKNKGIRGAEGSYEKEGIVLGGVGARFEKPDFMESRHMQIYADEQGNILIPQISGRDAAYSQEQHNMWQEFYNSIPTNPVKSAEPYLTISGEKGGGFLDALTYKKAIKVRLHSYLSEADLRAKEAGDKNAYIHLPGLGLGVWQVHDKQKDLYVEALEELLQEKTYANITDIDLSWVGSNRIKAGFGKAIRGVNLFASNNNPSQKNKMVSFKELAIDGVPTGQDVKIETQDKLLVVIFAWDGNSFVANEGWTGSLDGSGDPAQAASSPDILTAFTAYLNLFEQKGLIVVKEIEGRKDNLVKIVAREATMVEKQPMAAKAEVVGGVASKKVAASALAPASVPAPAWQDHSVVLDKKPSGKKRSIWDEDEDDSEEEMPAAAQSSGYPSNQTQPVATQVVAPKTDRQLPTLTTPGQGNRQSEEKLPTIEEMTGILQEIGRLTKDNKHKLSLLKYVLEKNAVAVKNRISIAKRDDFKDFDFKITQEDQTLLSMVLLKYAGQNPEKQVKFVYATEDHRGISSLLQIAGKKLSEITDNQEIKQLIQNAAAEQANASLQQPVGQVKVVLQPPVPAVDVQPAIRREAGFAQSARDRASTSSAPQPVPQVFSGETEVLQAMNDLQQSMQQFFDKCKQAGVKNNINITLKSGGNFLGANLKVEFNEDWRVNILCSKAGKKQPDTTCEVGNFASSLENALLSLGSGNLLANHLEEVKGKINKKVNEKGGFKPVEAYTVDDVAHLTPKAARIKTMSEEEKQIFLQEILKATPEDVSLVYGAQNYEYLADAVEAGAVEIVQAVFSKIRQGVDLYTTSASTIDNFLRGIGKKPLMHSAVFAQPLGHLSGYTSANSPEASSMARHEQQERIKRTRMVTLLHSLGFDIDKTKDGESETPLYLIAGDPKKTELAKNLIELGANPNTVVKIRGKDVEKSVLFAAIEGRNYELAQFLINQGARIDYASYEMAIGKDSEVGGRIQALSNICQSMIDIGGVAEADFINEAFVKTEKSLLRKPVFSFNYDPLDRRPNYYLTFRKKDEAEAFLSSITEAGVRNNQGQRKIVPANKCGDVVLNLEGQYFKDLPEIYGQGVYLNSKREKIKTQVEKYQVILTGENVRFLKERRDLISSVEQQFKDLVKARKDQGFGSIDLNAQVFYDKAGISLFRDTQIKMTRHGVSVQFTDHPADESSEAVAHSAEEFTGYQWLNKLSNDELRLLKDRIQSKMRSQEEDVGGAFESASSAIRRLEDHKKQKPHVFNRRATAAVAPAPASADAAYDDAQYRAPKVQQLSEEEYQIELNQVEATMRDFVKQFQSNSKGLGPAIVVALTDLNDRTAQPSLQIDVKERDQVNRGAKGVKPIYDIKIVFNDGRQSSAQSLDCDIDSFRASLDYFVGGRYFLTKGNLEKIKSGIDENIIKPKPRDAVQKKTASFVVSPSAAATQFLPRNHDQEEGFALRQPEQGSSGANIVAPSASERLKQRQLAIVQKTQARAADQTRANQDRVRADEQRNLQQPSSEQWSFTPSQNLATTARATTARATTTTVAASRRGAWGDEPAIGQVWAPLVTPPSRAADQNSDYATIEDTLLDTVRPAVVRGRAATVQASVQNVASPPPLPLRQNTAAVQASQGRAASASSPRDAVGAPALPPRHYPTSTANQVVAANQANVAAAEDRPKKGILSRAWKGLKGIFGKKSREANIGDGEHQDLRGVVNNPQPVPRATQPENPYPTASATPQRALFAAQGTSRANSQPANPYPPAPAPAPQRNRATAQDTSRAGQPAENIYATVRRLDGQGRGGNGRGGDDSSNA